MGKTHASKDTADEKVDGRKPKQLLLYLSDEQHAKVQRIATAEGRSMSSVLRELIDNARDYEFTPKRVSGVEDAW